jgi:hypothetical protein
MHMVADDEPRRSNLKMQPVEMSTQAWQPLGTCCRDVNTSLAAPRHMLESCSTLSMQQWQQGKPDIAFVQLCNCFKLHHVEVMVRD